jgi:hypothetical protein
MFGMSTAFCQARSLNTTLYHFTVVLRDCAATVPEIRYSRRRCGRSSRAITRLQLSKSFMRPYIVFQAYVH